MKVEVVKGALVSGGRKYELGATLEVPEAKAKELERRGLVRAIEILGEASAGTRGALAGQGVGGTE